jgi:hypothetical protein
MTHLEALLKFLLFNEWSQGPKYRQIPVLRRGLLLRALLPKRSDFLCVCCPLIRVCHVQRAL